MPAAHGGFETFADYLARFLVARGWAVTVYCQEIGRGAIVEDSWEGVRRVRIPVSRDGSVGSILFDWQAVRHASQSKELCLTLGYNTAVFCAMLRLSGIVNLINMDGIEWKRAKWSPPARAWLYANDWAGCLLGNHLIADHPEIKAHLTSRVKAEKITVIPYGADDVQTTDPAPLAELNLEPGQFLTLIARAEPENSVLEAVTAFSRRPRGLQLVVLGHYVDSNPYHRAVKAAASAEVRFVGAIYDKTLLKILRCHCAAYIHGHQVGGTNPSLVEAMGAGNPVLAHDNHFNRWVAGSGARYFASVDACAAELDAMLADPAILQAMSAASRERFHAEFQWPAVLGRYEELLLEYLPQV